MLDATTDITQADRNAHIHASQCTSLDEVRRLTPAAFATTPSLDRGRRYKFISTEQLVEALLRAGFAVASSCQTKSRNRLNDPFTRHMLRFRHVCDSVMVGDAVPEIVLVNSHDGTSSYQLRAGLYRAVCSNGLLARAGDFGLIIVPHRGNVIDNVLHGALALIKDFGRIGEVVQRMRARRLNEAERSAFAAAGLQIRYPGPDMHPPYPAARLLQTQRVADDDTSLWHVFNTVQENLVAGGITGTSARGRRVTTRRITAIREDVRLNTGLWQLAMALLG